MCCNPRLQRVIRPGNRNVELRTQEEMWLRVAGYEPVRVSGSSSNGQGRGEYELKLAQMFGCSLR